MTDGQPPWPIAIVTGFLGSGKTTLITRLLHDPDMRDTMVIVNEFGDIGLDHHLIQAVTDTVILLANGCLCCRVRQDVVQTLRALYRDWLAGAIPGFRRVLIETTGLAEPGPLVASLCGHPLLSDAFALRGVTTLVDAEHGLDQLARGVTCRNQICAADHLFLSKCDLVGAAQIVVLRDQLHRLNPLAEIRQTDGVIQPGWLFQHVVVRPVPSSLFCAEGEDHLAGIATLLLRSDTSLVWTSFRLWLSDVLDKYGSRLLRLKGRLTFDASAGPVIIQAVHHSFYPVEPAPHAGENFLVLIFDGPAPPDVAAGFNAMTMAL
ncbi:CobW family GTP-binding protein [Acidisoma cladoniae]|uniref:CobW family GTP-binding protein n=1 Tax=Acidisoma cladoniae TaxID=3040935 RepID=UPI00254A82C2|nr:GTP-binding protein [Acidisoma sp. PAMC 29798]